MSCAPSSASTFRTRTPCSPRVSRSRTTRKSRWCAPCLLFVLVWLLALYCAVSVLHLHCSPRAFRYRTTRKSRWCVPLPELPLLLLIMGRQRLWLLPCSYPPASCVACATPPLQSFNEPVLTPTKHQHPLFRSSGWSTMASWWRRPGRWEQPSTRWAERADRAFWVAARDPRQAPERPAARFIDVLCAARKSALSCQGLPRFLC